MNARVKALGLTTAVTIAAASLTLGIAGSASAVGACANGYFCQWQNSGWTAGALSLFDSTANYSADHYNNGDSLADSVSSWKNADTAHYVLVFTGTSGTGAFLEESPGGYRENLADDTASDGKSMNDRAMSMCFVGTGAVTWCNAD